MYLYKLPTKHGQKQQRQQYISNDQLIAPFFLHLEFHFLKRQKLPKDLSATQETAHIQTSKARYSSGIGEISGSVPSRQLMLSKY